MEWKPYEDPKMPLPDVEGGESFTEFYIRYRVYYFTTLSILPIKIYRQEIDDYINGIENEDLNNRISEATYLFRLESLPDLPEIKRRDYESSKSFNERWIRRNDYYFAKNIISIYRMHNPVKQQKYSLPRFRISYISKCLFGIAFIFILYLIALNGRYENIGNGYAILDKWKKQAFVIQTKECPLIMNDKESTTP
ncbi:MAG: hypothetical protein PHT07_15825 [Paludibacter sp.]|nr:hypothetical protein [Paludibacter sp.]